MEETKNTANASQPEKDEKPKKAEKKAEKKSGSFLAEHRAEMRKVTWPNRQELAKETVTVIVVSLLVGAIIFGMDTALSFCYDKLMTIGGANSAESSTTNEINPADLISVGGDEENSPVNVEVEDQGEEGTENAEKPAADESAENAEKPAADEGAENAEKPENNEGEGAENAEQSENNKAAQADNAENSDNAGAENAEQ